ncbi:redoxin domain-containing protein [Halorussus lipolyticus]|uniref:redoxin domain-containing protein n=1 Tax=Halorussus lipolyticus TaxID=3034024 RepID=UPI0023E78070|nr:redoxin domain-containing protein [Halorussus sp. DT80]
MLSVGTDVPDFELPGIQSEDRDEYRLSEYTDDGAVLLAFYPCDFSPVCTRELCAIRNVEWFEFENVQVLGISQDSLYAHREFAGQHDITFPLLSDTDGDVTERFDVRYDSWEGQAGLGKRAFFVVDETQTVRYAWSADDAYEKPDLEEVLDAISRLSEPLAA